MSVRVAGIESLARASAALLLVLAGSTAAAREAARTDAPKAVVQAERLRVAFIGGSITEGAFSTAPDKSYAGLLTAWLGTRYRHVEARNIGVGGTGSDFAAYRVDHDLAGFTPDLAILEFTVNDAGKSATQMAGYLDAIATRLRVRNPRVKLVYVSTTDVNEEPERRAGHRAPYVERAAAATAKLGIPFVDATTGMWRKVLAGTPVRTFIVDAVHPDDAGHQLYFEAIRDALAPGIPLAPQPSVTRGRLIARTRLDTARLEKGAAAKGCHAGTLSLRYMDAALTCDKGESFTYDFSGTTVGLVRAMVHDGGRLACTLDGDSPVTADFYDEVVRIYERAFPMFLYKDLPQGPHRLACTVSDAIIRVPGGMSTGHKATIGYFMVSDERPVTP